MSINAKRALFVLLLAKTNMRPNAPQIEMIREAVRYETEQRNKGAVKSKDLLFGQDEGTLQKSVSLGLKELVGLNLDPELGLDLTKYSDQF